MGLAIKRCCWVLASAMPFAMGGMADAKKLDPAVSATFIVSKGYGKAKLLGGSQQMFVHQPVLGSCKKLKWITGVNWSDPAEKSVLVAAGAPINLYAQSKINSDGGWMTTLSNKCASSVTFTPRIGASYSVVQPAHPPAPCDLQIIDRATGAPPPDLVVNPNPPLCGGYM